MGIETSCDDTAVAIVRGGTETLVSLVSSQITSHAQFGGVVPELASRMHLEALSPMVELALSESGLLPQDLHGLAVTSGPGLIGSLLVGVSHAKALSAVWNLPLVGVNHLEGHIFASRLEYPGLKPPFVTLIVSGGHTLLIHVVEFGNYEVLGGTIDDAAGEAYDKVARFMGLGYPGGPAIDGLAVDGDPLVASFPRALRGESFDFSFSGLKTAVTTFVRKNPDAKVADVARCFQDAVVEVLVEKALAACELLGVDTLVIAGGVAANSALRAQLLITGPSRSVEVFIPARSMCTDNAAMIASVGCFYLGRGQVADDDLGAYPSLGFPGVDRSSEFSTR